MRILVDYRPALRERTGVGEYTHWMATTLATQGERVTLFSSSWKDRLRADAVPGADTIDARIPVSVLNYAWHRLEWPPVERLGADADVAWSMHPLLLPATTAAQVVTIHDLFFLDHPERTTREVRRDYATLAADHARRADGVVVVSEYTRTQVIDRLAIPADRISVCGSGAPRWQRRPEPTAPGPILHVGTVEPRKNIPALVSAYAELLSREPTAPDLVLAGRVDAEAELRLVDASNIRDRIQVLGYVDDPTRRRLFYDASLLVLASSDEGFGLPALEAMAIGVPVVAARRGSLPEVVGDAGILVDPGDPQAFAEAMLRVLRDRELQRQLADRGVARAATFSWEASAGKARVALAAAIERRRGRS